MRGGTLAHLIDERLLTHDRRRMWSGEERGDQTRPSGERECVDERQRVEPGVQPPAPVRHERVLVEGLNIVQRHTKPSQGDPQGGVKNKEAPVHISNVAYVDSAGKPTRVGFRVENDKKVRFAKTSGEVIDG